MTTHRLPGRIAAIMAGTVVVLVLTVATAVFWMTEAMDEQSRRHSGDRIRGAVFDVLDQMRSTTLDYAKRDETARRVAAGDLRWLRHHIGTSATYGDLVQLAVIWGGPLSQNVGWTDAGGTAPRSGVLDPAVIRLAETGIAGLPIDTYRGVAFFARRDGEVYALAAARIEAEVGSPAPAWSDADLGRLAMGRRLDAELVRRIGDSALLDRLEIVAAKPGDRPSLPLMGGDARPVAYLAWHPQLAGSALLRRMLPLLILVTTLAVGLVLTGMTLARRGAHLLVQSDRRSAAAARTDGLTGLANRLAFTEALAAPASAGERAILYLDLNGFKRINDSIGHAVGDQVIRGMAQRLGQLGGPDCLLARIGGDEFAFVIAGANAGFRAEWIAHAVERAMATPFAVQGHQMRLKAAIGYAVQDDDLTPGDTLVRQADLAMYEAKRLRSGAVAFGDVIDQADRDARAIERALQAALSRPQGPGDELSIAYQPIVDVGTGRLVRAEALARWTSPALGRVPPDRFIAVAERSGLIVELGRRLLALICDDLAAHPALQVSLNVSPLQLMAPAFVADLVADLARRGIDPARIEVELTERVLVDDPKLASRRLDELHAAGFSTALDDFGAGYSSIGTLQQMTFDTLKVDRSFVSGLITSSERLTLCNAMILLGHGLGLGIVCEGVETAEELEMLRALGCGLAQGYHFDRPMPIDDLIARWTDGAERPAAVA